VKKYKNGKSHFCQEGGKINNMNIIGTDKEWAYRILYRFGERNRQPFTLMDWERQMRIVALSNKFLVEEGRKK